MYVTSGSSSVNVKNKYKLLVEKLLESFIKFQRLNECKAFR